MSFRTAGSNAIASKVLKGTSTPWVRNPSWPSLPSVSGLQKLAGLYAVTPDASFISFTCTGAYTVDWGDGVTENVATNTQAYHQYDFNDADLANSNAPCTFTDAGDLVNRTAHGYKNGMVVRFYNIVSTTGITDSAPYYVISATADTFQISATRDGSAVALTSDGSASLLNYKIAVVTIVPNGGNITNFHLDKKHNRTGLQTRYVSGWLDIAVEGANLTSLNIASNTLNVQHANLEQFSLTGTNSITSFAYLLYQCINLQSVPSLTHGTLTNCSYLFSWCMSLRSVPSFITTNVTVFTQMFNYNFNLREAPYLNTAAGTTFVNMFSSCITMVSVPSYNLTAATSVLGMFTSCESMTSYPNFTIGNSCLNFSNMFTNNFSLRAMPQINTSAGTDFSSMFAYCYSLVDTCTLSTGSGTDFTSMFNSCFSMTNPPYLNTASGITFTSMFKACYSMAACPLYNTSNGTGFSEMFNQAYSLQTIPLLDTSKGTNMSTFIGNSAFANFSNVTSLPALNLSSSTNNGSFFYNPVCLYSAPFVGTKATISFSGAKLSKAALEAIFTGLGLGTSQTVTVSNNYGAVTPVALTGTSTAGSATITMASTTGIVAGDTVTGNGTALTNPQSVTLNDTGDIVSNTAHGLSDGDPISFSVITNTTGISVNVIYYVVSKADNTFQIAATAGGAALPLTNSGTGSLRYAAKVVSIVTNTSVTLDRPLTSSTTNTFSYRALDISKALLRGWTVTGG